MADNPVVRVGVGVVVVKNGKILLGKRRGAHGSGAWSFPGGHLEFNEEIEACAVREVAEETGLKIKNLKRIEYTNDIFNPEGKHYITLFVIAEIESGEPKIMEPDKCAEIKWFDINNLPKKIFDASERMIAHYKGEPLG